MSSNNESHELTDRSKSSPETSVTKVSVQVKNQPKQKKKDEEKVKKYNKEIETLKQEKCKIEKDIVLLGGKPDELLKLDDSHSYSESIATSYSLPVQPRKGKDTKKFNKDLKRINDLVKKLRGLIKQIEELEKKREERLKNTVAEMSEEPKESKEQSVSSSSLQSSSKGSFPHRRSSSQKNKKATAAERSENASLSSLPHHSSSPEVPQETEQQNELVRKLKEKDEEIEKLKIEKEIQTTEAQKESQRSQERIKELENDVEKEREALLHGRKALYQVENDTGKQLADEHEKILKLEEDKRLYLEEINTLKATIAAHKEKELKEDPPDDEEQFHSIPQHQDAGTLYQKFEKTHNSLHQSEVDKTTTAVQQQLGPQALHSEPHVPQSGDTKMPAVKKELLTMSTKEEVKQLQDQLKQLQDKLTDKEAELSETHVARDELLKEKRMLEESIKQMEQEVIKKEEALKESTQLKGQLTQLQGELATLRAKPEELEAVMKERDDLVKEKVETEKEIHKSRLEREKIVKDLTEEKKKSDKVINEQQKCIEELKSKLEEDSQVKYGIKDAIGEEPKRSVSLERSASMGSATATETQMAALYLKQIEDLKSEKATLETELDKAKEHNQQLAEHCKKLDGERDALAIELKQLQDKQALKEVPPKSKMEGDHLKEGIVYQLKKSQEDQERKEGISQTEGTVSEKGGLDLKQISHIRQQLSDQREKIKRLEKEKEELEKASKIPSTQQVKELKKQLDDAIKTIHNLEDQLEEMTVKWTKELETVKKLRSEREEQDKLMTSWDWRREESLREKDTAKDQLKDYKKKQQSTDERLRALEAENKQLLSEQQVMQKESKNIHQIEQEKESLNARIALLLEEKQGLSEEIEARKSHEVGLRQTIVNYSEEKERLKSAIEELQKELEVKTAMEEQFTIQLQTYEQDFQQERKDRENAHGKIADLEEKYRKELKEVSTDRDENLAQLTGLKEQLVHQKNELHRMNRELEHMRDTSTGYEQKLIKQEEQFMKREKTLVQQKERLDQEVKKSKTEIQQLMGTNEEYSKKQRNLKQFETAYLAMTQNAHQLEQQVEALQKTQHAISQQVRDLQAEKAALESRNKELKQLTDHVTAENERLNNQVQYVFQQNRSLASEVKHLKENNQSLEEVTDRMRRSVTRFPNSEEQACLSLPTSSKNLVQSLVTSRGRGADQLMGHQDGQFDDNLFKESEKDSPPSSTVDKAHGQASGGPVQAQMDRERPSGQIEDNRKYQPEFQQPVKGSTYPTERGPHQDPPAARYSGQQPSPEGTTYPTERGPHRDSPAARYSDQQPSPAQGTTYPAERGPHRDPPAARYSGQQPLPRTSGRGRGEASVIQGTHYPHSSAYNQQAGSTYAVEAANKPHRQHSSEPLPSSLSERSSDPSLPEPYGRPGQFSLNPSIKSVNESTLFAPNEKYIGEDINHEIQHEAKRAQKDRGEILHADSETDEQDWPFDPNLTCPKCKVVFRRGQIREYRYHVDECEV